MNADSISEDDLFAKGIEGLPFPAWNKLEKPTTFAVGFITYY